MIVLANIVTTLVGMGVYPVPILISILIHTKVCVFPYVIVMEFYLIPTLLPNSVSVNVVLPDIFKDKAVIAVAQQDTILIISSV